jgi:hypothetical protein
MNAFQKWVEDIEERAAWHLFNHPEKEPLIVAKDMSTALAHARGTPIVEVRESVYIRDSYAVWVDNKCSATFFGDDAKEQAERRADEIRRGPLFNS